MIRRVGLLVGLALWLGPVAPSGPRSFGLRVALAEQDWRKEFDEVCAMTQDAMALPVEDLRKLVARCDKLQPRIDQLEESPRKIYSRKLQACRNLYQFVLDSKAGA